MDLDMDVDAMDENGTDQKPVGPEYVLSKPCVDPRSIEDHVVPPKDVH